MPPGSKRQKLKALVRKPFSSKKKDEAVSNEVATSSQATSVTTHSPAVSVAAVSESSPSTSTPKIVVHDSTNQVSGIIVGSGGGFFSHSSNFSVNNPIMVDNSTNMTVNISSDERSKGMKHLSKHTIHGAARDSSARSPPPRCHPGTRKKINEHIITWFYDEERQELLAWVYGQAGVGKSAIMQTIADELAKSLHLGASVFISRPNGRNSSRKLFLTVGYQLAVQIEEYCIYITEQLARDPEIVDKGMEEQFKIFIVEPFSTRKIGVSAQPWAILLDGLDELDEHEWQLEIIHLVANFVHEHPDAPLRWAIASRPEPHILDTFEQDDVMHACWKLLVPVDREDVEHYLEENLERIRKKFPRTVPKEWPSKEQFRTLVYRASGLFIFANTVIRFIEDPRYANPVTRLNQVLSALDGAATTSPDHPLAPLDTLYASILSTIPHDVWPTTKRVLGALLYPELVLKKLGGISIVLGLDLTAVYGSVNGCYSLLQLSDPEDAYTESTTFYHASFSDYLRNPSRSQNFCISMGDVEEDVVKSALTVWQKFKANFSLIPGLTYEKRWIRYLLSLGIHDKYAPGIGEVLVPCIHGALFGFLVQRFDPEGQPFSSKEDQDQCFDVLNDWLDIFSRTEYPGGNKIAKFWPWLFDLFEAYQDELVSRGMVLVEMLETIKPLQVGSRLAHMQFIGGERTQQTGIFFYDMLESHQIIDQISVLQSHSPQLPVLVSGSPGNCHLLLRHQVDAVDPQFGGPIDPPVFRYISFPFSDFNSYHEAEHFLKTGFQAIQRRYSSLVPSTWPSKEQFLKVAGAVAHYLPFAHIALQFIQDPYSANPITHLDQLLSLIDRVDPDDDQPFIYVDAFYTHILNSIPSEMWQITQQVLGALLYSTTFSCQSLRFAKDIGTFFGLDLDAVYASLDYCHLMILTSPTNLPWTPIVLSHTSFCQYLMDAARSKNFFVSTDHVLRVLYDMWLDFKMQFPGIFDFANWSQYLEICPRGNPNLVHDIHEALVVLTQYEPTELESKQTRDQVFHALGQLDFWSVSMVRWKRPQFAIWLFGIWKMYQAELTGRGLFHAIEFRKLPVDHCPVGDIQSAPSHTLSRCVDNEMKMIVGERLDWSNTNSERYKEYISGLHLFQQYRPQLEILIGGMLGARFAIFEYEYIEDDLLVKHDAGLWKLELGDRGYYVLSCPDEV